MEDKKEFFLIIYIFVLGMIFSAIGLLDSKLKSESKCCEGKTRLLVALEFLSHSMISGIVSIVIFTMLTEYYPDWSIYLRGSISVMGAAISDSIVERVKEWLRNGK